MPKGALLHVHIGAAIDSSYLLKLGLNQSAMHVRVHSHLTPDSLKKVLPEFTALRPDEYTVYTSLTSDSYKLGEWVNLALAKENFDPDLGGPQGFEDWVVGALTIDPSEAYGTYNSHKKVYFDPRIYVSAVRNKYLLRSGTNFRAFSLLQR